MSLVKQESRTIDNFSQAKVNCMSDICDVTAKEQCNAKSMMQLHYCSNTENTLRSQSQKGIACHATQLAFLHIFTLEKNAVDASKQGF